MSRQQFLYRLTLVRPALLIEGPTADEARIIAEHFAYLKGLTEAGTMILAGRTQTTGPETFGLAILEAASDGEARAIMESDPAVSSGLMSAELFPYKIALMRQTPLPEAAP
ncbi:hypothetical protein BH10PSE7_BH10PSE7_30500 [soil metagenome]